MRISSYFKKAPLLIFLLILSVPVFSKAQPVTKDSIALRCPIEKSIFGTPAIPERAAKFKRHYLLTMNEEQKNVEYGVIAGRFLITAYDGSNKAVSKVSLDYFCDDGTSGDCRANFDKKDLNMLVLAEDGSPIHDPFDVWQPRIIIFRNITNAFDANEMAFNRSLKMLFLENEKASVSFDNLLSSQDLQDLAVWTFKECKK